MAALMATLSLWILKEYFQTFFKKKEGKKNFYPFWGIYFVWQICTIQQLVNWPVYMRILVNIILIFCISTINEGSILRKITFIILYNSTWMMMEFLTGYIFITFGIFNHSIDLLGSLVSKVLLLILVKGLQVFFEQDSVHGLPQRYSIVFILILNGSMYVVYDSFMMRCHSGGDINIFSSFMTLFVMLIINFLIFKLYLHLSENLELKRNNLVFEQAIDLYDIHIKEKENSAKEFRRIRHDLKNQLIYLKELLKEGKYNELYECLVKLIAEEPFNNLLIVNTDNSVIDALVNYKYSWAKSHGIEFYAKLDVPTVLPFASSDICVILGNALDNAVEANIRFRWKNKHYIKLLMRMEDKNLIILVENTFNGDVKKSKQGKLLSMKEDIDNHGIGMESIRKAAEKYHGYVATECEKNLFKLRIILYS